MSEAAVGRAGADDALRAAIAAFLDAHHTMTLATVDDDGRAHAASLLYVADGFDLVWTSDRDSRHSQHLERRGGVAATVAPDYADFRAIRGLQIFGTATRLVDVGDVAAASARMVARYAFLRSLAQAPALLEAWRRATFYRLTPASITLIDNTVKFGDKKTLVFDAGR